MTHQNLSVMYMSEQINILQSQLDLAYQSLTDDLNKKQYLDRLEQIQKEFPELVKEEFSNRQDKRTFVEFGESMMRHMMKEREIADYWMGKYGEQWFGTNSYEYKGVEASGRLICGRLKLRSTFKEPDLLLLNKEKEYLELKTCRVLNKAIYKEVDIRHYGELGNVNIVTLHSSGNFSPKKVAYYTLLTPTCLSLLLAKMDSGEVLVEPRGEFGGKRCVHFTREQLSDHFYVELIAQKT